MIPNSRDKILGERGINKIPVGIGYEQLVEGYEFPHLSHELSTPTISRYLEAVDGKVSHRPLEGFVPPMAIAACSIGALSQSLALSAGAIHASQELEFLKLVPIGVTVECHTKVVRKLQRGAMRLLVLELSIFNQDKEQVLLGKATLVLPS